MNYTSGISTDLPRTKNTKCIEILALRINNVLTKVLFKTILKIVIIFLPAYPVANIVGVRNQSDMSLVRVLNPNGFCFMISVCCLASSVCSQNTLSTTLVLFCTSGNFPSIVPICCHNLSLKYEKSTNLHCFYFFTCYILITIIIKCRCTFFVTLRQYLLCMRFTTF